jgi:predicted MFS family arabinose efflux permease
MQGHLLVGVCTMAAATSPSFIWGCGSFFLAGLGYSFLNPASTIGVMAWFHRDERATAMGAKQTGVPGGGVVTATLAPALVLIFGWRGALATLGAINFVFGFVFAKFWREPSNEFTEETVAPAGAAEAPQSLNVVGLLPISCATALYLIGQMALITYVTLYLKDAMSFSPYWASQALALTQGGAVIGRVGWGVVSDRLFGGRRKIVLLLIGVFSVALFVALSRVTPQTSYGLLMLVLFFLGVCIVGYQGVSYALIGEIAGKSKTGAGLGMMITINAGAATLGTPLFGYIVDRSGSYSIAWLSLAALLTIGIVGLAMLLEEPKHTS